MGHEEATKVGKSPLIVSTILFSRSIGCFDARILHPSSVFKWMICRQLEVSLIWSLNDNCLIKLKLDFWIFENFKIYQKIINLVFNCISSTYQLSCSGRWSNTDIYSFRKNSWRIATSVLKSCLKFISF